MPAAADKKPGDPARVRQEDSGKTFFENDWTIVRFEPNSGNAVLEKDSKRITVPRAEFEIFNFKGSDDLWQALTADYKDGERERALAAWLGMDTFGVRRALVAYARTLDPSFAGVQTVADLAEKIRMREDAIKSSLSILRMDVARAEREYNRFEARTAFENDRKDALLTKVRNLQDQCDAKNYENDTLLPIWQKVLAALNGIEAE